MSNTNEYIIFNREQLAKCSGNGVRRFLLTHLSYLADENDITRISLRQLGVYLPKRKRNKRRLGRTLRWMEKEGMIVLDQPVKTKGLNEIKVTNNYQAT